MASVTPSMTQDISTYDMSLKQWTWLLTTADADGLPVQIPEWADMTWQAVGFSASGAICSIEGSHDGTNWFTLHNAAGSAVATLGANGMITIIELPRYMRPNLSTPGTNAEVTVILLARRANPMRQ